MNELTAFEVKALRAADDIAFFHKEDGTGLMKAIKRADYNVPFSEDRSVEIVVDSGFRNYGRDEGFVPETAFALVGQYHHGAETLATAIRAIRAGDKVLLDWAVDGNRNGYAQDAGLHADTLTLIVLRPNRRGGFKQVGGYEIASSINPGNSARMIRGQYRKAVAE